jgi:hypothetical protein
VRKDDQKPTKGVVVSCKINPSKRQARRQAPTFSTSSSHVPSKNPSFLNNDQLPLRQCRKIRAPTMPPPSWIRRSNKIIHIPIHHAPSLHPMHLPHNILPFVLPVPSHPHPEMVHRLLNLTDLVLFQEFPLISFQPTE